MGDSDTGDSGNSEITVTGTRPVGGSGTLPLTPRPTPPPITRSDIPGPSSLPTSDDEEERDEAAEAAGGLSERIRELSEANITDSNETVLGHFPGYIDKASANGASYFDIGDSWDDLTPDQRWAANVNFLDKIAEKGDAVKLSIPKGEIRPDSYLAKEIEYLIKNKGYTWVNQWALKPPSGDDNG